MRPGKDSPHLVIISLTAIAVGVFCAAALAAFDLVSEEMTVLLWERLPESLGFEAYTWWWIALVLLSAGAVVGLIVWKWPWGAGHDPAVSELIEPPMPVAQVPGLLVCGAVTLAAGVSLGPENPIMAANVAVVAALGGRIFPHVKDAGWGLTATAATVSALFGTPVAAALALTEIHTSRPSGEPLWNRLFTPLLAAGTASVAMHYFGASTWTRDLPAYEESIGDIATAPAVAAGATVAAAGTVWLFPRVYRLFQRLPNPMVRAVAGAAVLAVLAVVGGPLTMFKGANESVELLGDAASYTAVAILGLLVVKMLAIVVAGTTGFRGGRIFPMIFCGVAFGVMVADLVPFADPALSIACSVLAFSFVATGQGWLSLFLAVGVVADATVLPILCIAVLPVWLIVHRVGPMHAEPEKAKAPA
ncbi:ion channel protein [Salininema proteolyticum]|uniref:Ion channel protein n=1 Tax=Salininema proteolyticum TaxID=1607685 RepID=A0ABV8TXY3_9ACTN